MNATLLMKNLAFRQCLNIKELMMRQTIYLLLFTLLGCADQSTDDSYSNEEVDYFETGTCVVQYYPDGEFYCIGDYTAYHCDLTRRYGPSFLEFHPGKQCSDLETLGSDTDQL